MGEQLLTYRAYALSLLQGHSADVYGVAWHPLKPYRFVTACECNNVYLYHAKRRVLLVRGTILR